MALQISTYVDPGVYIQEVITPGAINLQTLPVLPTVIAPGSRTRRIINEDIVRGQVAGETLSVASSSPYVATLSGRGSRRTAETTVFADGVALSDADFSYPASTLTGANTETFDLSTNNAIVLQMDSGDKVTITLTDGASTVTVAGRQIDVTTSLSGSGAAATAAEVAAGINAALGAASALGYGSAYNSVASASGGAVVLTSPTSGANSNITLSAALSTSATTAIFGANVQSSTVIRIADLSYDANVSAYTINYVDLDDNVDATANAAATSGFTRVGAFPGVGTYSATTDYTIPSAGNLNWNAALVAATTTATAGTYDLSTNDVIRLSIDGRAAINIDLNGLSPAPLGYSNPSSAASSTASEVADNINAVLAQSSSYGPDYQAVASVSGSSLVLTSPTPGSSGSVAILHPTSLDATTEIFGLTAAQTLTVTGTGSRPAWGSVYFVSYNYTRPAADYNTPQQFFTLETALAFTGPLATDNPLANAVETVFRNGAPSVVAIQVDDASSPGTPTGVEFQVALDAAGTRSTITDIICISTDLDVQTRLVQHIEDQSGPIESNYRRGYFGMPVNTAIGDRDTANTYVFRAARTLQVAADSPARGRLMLVAPPGIEGIKKDLLLETGAITTVTLDSTYLACAIAGRLASFTSPADALVRATVAGFRTNENDFTPWVRAERAQMANNGVTVVTFDAGRFLLLDPKSTERGGLIQFEQWSASVQKDNVVRQVRTALDANIVGLVPVDVTDFILDIKQYIANVLTSAIAEGAIGPYTDPSGNRRSIDLSQDIIVEQDRSDPTKYNFSFFFNLRYPALRLFGQYSVDNPFFSQAA